MKINIENPLTRSILLNLLFVGIFTLIFYVFTPYWEGVTLERGDVFMQWFYVAVFVGLFGFVSSFITYGITKYGKIFWLGGALFAIAFLMLIYGVCRGFKSGNLQQIPEETTVVAAPPILHEPVIETQTGSKWHQDNQNKEQYYHVITKGESLEYVFNNIETSLQAAREQHILILKHDNTPTGFVEVLPEAFETELERGTFLYSGSAVGDTVWLTRQQLEKFKRERKRTEW